MKSHCASQRRGEKFCPSMVTDPNVNGLPSVDYSRNDVLLQVQMGKIQKQIRKKKEYRKYRGTLALGREVCKCKYSCKSS